MRIQNILRKICICICLISMSLFCKYGVCYNISSWIRSSGAFPGDEITSLATSMTDSETLFVGTKGFLYKTVDGGMTWENVYKLPGIKKSVNFIRIDPINSGVIYIATETGVFKSVDSGKDWKSISSELRDVPVHSLLTDAEDHNILLAATENGIFISEVFARRHNLPVNRQSDITLITNDGPRTFQVTGVFYDYATPRGFILMRLERYQSYWDDPMLTSLSLYLGPNEDADAITLDLQDQFASQ